MENGDLFQITGTIQDALGDIKSETANLQILKDHFLTNAMVALFEARRGAGLSQEEVARLMGTSQPAVARWEHDLEGSISLRRYVDFAMACGAIPQDVTLEPILTRSQGYLQDLFNNFDNTDLDVELRAQSYPTGNSDIKQSDVIASAA